MTFLPGDLYHSGFLVADLDSAVTRLEAVGIRRWTVPKTNRHPVRSGSGEVHDAQFRYVYSCDGPHHFELIEPLDAAFLGEPGAMDFHHLGFWVDDPEEVTRLALGAGLSLDFSYLEDDGSVKVSYLQDSAGLRFELVPKAYRTILEERFAAVQAMP